MSVVVPTRDRREELRRCLAALARQSASRRYEVVVVDDGTEPPLTEEEVRGPEDVSLVRGEGRGPAAARNLGVQAARGEAVLFTDDDTIPDDGWLEAACGHLEAHPAEVGVEGVTISPPYDPLYEHSVSSDHPGQYLTCNIAYRREPLLRLGGFDEAFPAPHCEDLDLALRAKAHGPVGFAAEMRVVHPPHPLPMRKLVGRAGLAHSEVLLARRHPEHYGRVATHAPRLFPVYTLVTRWRDAFRREGAQLVRSPRRLGRMVVAAGGQLLVTLFAVATAGAKGRR